MKKYRIQELLDEYIEDGKKGKRYKEVYRKVIDDTGINPQQFYQARHWKITDSNTLTSDNLIKIAVALGVTVDELLNYPPELANKRKPLEAVA